MVCLKVITITTEIVMIIAGIPGIAEVTTIVRG